ncbi:hypothetical protein K437DRAFT_274110 [Tilletiaria anomala UBC 951]|uniref:Required for respiratory growth protein 9, mitochondrial n=1 Tax=Tilletiaria anomala (strain ATCC 24038 / CBS 436.72 / UBC 951) TaxID=1037660 RepID=A0A066W057_TILAU|nr:uncharacterized protein K437DRAFT_274110 [Tilletiaria anomala UBC 951]KDN45908.1 hypothetical protein K437DRAFT_274110 [Tilletiaria anomala UBC 951]
MMTTRGSRSAVCQLCRQQVLGQRGLTTASIPYKAAASFTSFCDAKGKQRQAALCVEWNGRCRSAAVSSFRSLSTSHRVASAEKPESSSSQSAVPWFMEDEVVSPPSIDAEDAIADDAEASLSIISPRPESSTLPIQLEHLYELLTHGSAAALVARPHTASSLPYSFSSSEYELEDSKEIGDASGPIRSPIQFIHAKAISQHDAWCDWIVVLETRGNTVGLVRKLALEVGDYLRSTRPPHTLDPAASFVASLVSTTSAAASTASTISETCKHVPAEVAGTAWRPRRILTREAQSALRVLHASDPEGFSLPRLAAEFKISRESVRRILKSGRKIPGAEAHAVAAQSKWTPDVAAEERQLRRALERREEKRRVWMEGEEQQIEELRRKVRSGLMDTDTLKDDSPTRARQEEELVEDAYAHQDGQSANSKNLYKHPVRYEGMPHSATNVGGAAARRATRSQGEGNWCMVDAGWCVVHVMTPQARQLYEIESIWEDQMREEAYPSV